MRHIRHDSIPKLVVVLFCVLVIRLLVFLSLSNILLSVLPGFSESNPCKNLEPYQPYKASVAEIKWEDRHPSHREGRKVLLVWSPEVLHDMQTIVVNVNMKGHSVAVELYRARIYWTIT